VVVVVVVGSPGMRAQLISLGPKGQPNQFC